VLPDAFAEALAAPPQIHPDGPGGVWRTDDSCYEFIAQHVTRQSVTLETGIGLSTAEFAILGCTHSAVFLDPREGEVFTGWASEHGIDLHRVRLIPDGSERVLPVLDVPPLDLVFIDGQHGYPMPQLDFMYACSHLKRGGVLVIDDTQLWAPRQLQAYLDADTRWAPLERTDKWAAYRRLSEGSLVENEGNQPFGVVAMPRSMTLRQLLRALPSATRKSLRFHLARFRSALPRK
jgi:Methyltransferase domain